MRRPAAAVRGAGASSCWSPICGSSLFFLVPFLIVLKISLSETVIAQPPYTPVLDLAAGWDGIKDFFAGLSFDNYAACWRPALSLVLSQEPQGRGGLDAPSAAHRLCDRLWHGARAARPAAAARHPGGPAVLDVVPDPRLCLDQHPAARRPAEPGADGAAHRRRAAGLARDRHRHLSSASSIPICRSWCCRSMRRWRGWTRPCWRRPPISAARRGRRSGSSRCRCRCPASPPARCSASSRSSASSSSPICSAVPTR